MLDLSRIGGSHKVLRCNPDLAPCPRCGELVTRHETCVRSFWEADLRRVAITDVYGGCYICESCPPGERWFCLLPPEYQTSGQYALPTMRLIVDLVKVHKMTAESTAAFAHRVLKLSHLQASTVLDWMRTEAASADSRHQRLDFLEGFSGQIAIDEVYDAGFCQIVATDPIANRQLDYEILDHHATEEDVRVFCKRLRERGIVPALVVTDGSKLYPPVIAEVWPEAEHQRCVFHFIKQVNEELGKAFWDAYKSMPAPPKRSRGRPKKRGRPRQDARKRQDRQTVRDARYLFLAREANLDEKQLAKLNNALKLCPALRILRRFVLAIHELFGPTTTTTDLAQARRRAILEDPEYQSAKSLEKGLSHLADEDLFTRLTRYLDFENAEKTSNHVERENREYRKRQKGCYRLRSLRSIRALASLLRDRPRALRPGVRLTRRKPVCQEEEVRLAS